MSQLLSPTKWFVQSTWMMWESLFDVSNKLRGAVTFRYGICKLIVRKHHGKSVQCNDGIEVHPGDWVGELHLDNKKVLQLSRSVGPDRAALITARMMRDAIKQIGEAMKNKPELAEIRALTGITLLHRGIIHGIGFELHPLKSRWFQWCSTFYLRILLRAMHPAGRHRIDHSTEKLVPMMLIITRESLLQRISIHKTKLSATAQ